jgi:hypothetical protein
MALACDVCADRHPRSLLVDLVVKFRDDNVDPTRSIQISDRLRDRTDDVVNGSVSDEKTFQIWAGCEVLTALGLFKLDPHHARAHISVGHDSVPSSAIDCLLHSMSNFITQLSTTAKN